MGLSSDKKLVQKNGGTWHVNGLFTLFDAYPKMWIKQDDGSVVYGSITEEARRLSEIRTLVEEGVIDPSSQSGFRAVCGDDQQRPGRYLLRCMVVKPVAGSIHAGRRG